MKSSYFQKLDVLPQEDFESLLQCKDELINDVTGYRVIYPDGTIKAPGVYPNIYKGAVSNFTFDIEGYEPHLSPKFMQLTRAIYQALVENNLPNPKPYMVRCYRNNKVVEWHKHFAAASFADWTVYYGRKVPPKHMWVVIYYMHPNWDTKFKGDLQVGITPETQYAEYPCLSNSMVAHVGHLGHGVKELIMGYEGNRDIYLSHWITE